VELTELPGPWLDLGKGRVKGRKWKEREKEWKGRRKGYFD